MMLDSGHPQGYAFAPENVSQMFCPPVRCFLPIESCPSFVEYHFAQNVREGLPGGAEPRAPRGPAEHADPADKSQVFSTESVESPWTILLTTKTNRSCEGVVIGAVWGEDVLWPTVHRLSPLWVR